MVRCCAGHQPLSMQGKAEGALNAFQLNDVFHQYTCAARQLWKFCGDLSGSSAASTARALRAMPEDAEEIDWWARGRRRAPR
jgi:hypothetical protein